MTSWCLRGEAEQVDFGKRLAAAAGSRALIFLEGDLGAGKTTLVRGFLQGKGHQGHVKSPTYTLIEPYELLGEPCYHLDLYRLGDPEELEYLGLREMLQEQAVLLVEWPERGEGWLPAPDLEIRLSYSDDGDSRNVVLVPGTSIGKEIISKLQSHNSTDL